MCNEKYKISNRNPYDLVQISTSNRANIFKVNYGSDNRLYDYRVREPRPQPCDSTKRKEES